MTQNTQVSQEYLLIKCFLYKYTPFFTQQSAAATAGDFSLSTFTPYSIDLDDTKYFTKYDISRFVTDYTFQQNIDETTYSWSVTLQDLALSYGTINNSLKVQPLSGSTLTKGLAFSNSSNSIDLLAAYETNANTFDNNLDFEGPILQAKTNRGLTPGPLTVQNTNLTTVLSTISGLRLSDLIQEYDFISLFIYKNQTPITNIWGTFGVAELQPNNNNPLQFFTYVQTNDVPPVGLQNPVDPYLQQESVLLTKMPNGQTLFSNEFNGFVMKKNTSSTINQVDKVIVSGNGWSRLFGSTRRAIKTSLFANALYQAGQVTGLNDVSPYETIYAGQPIGSIIQGLFDTVYKIDFNTTTDAAISAASTPINPLNSTNLSTSTSIQAGFFASPLGVANPTAASTPFSGPTLPPLGSSFYNITSLIAGNSYPANLFTLPPYLLSTVMKLRPFAYIEPSTVPASVDFINNIVSQANALASVATSGDASTGVSPASFQQITQNVGGQIINYGSTSPVFLDPSVQNLQAYFQFLDNVFLSFSPELQTPYEILDQIRKITFVEIYEQANGQFIVRSPQYNNMAASVPGRSDISMIRSSNLNIMATNYTETVENLVSKILTGYSPNILPISVLQQFGYCDGKLLIQNGLLEMETAANPNAATASLSNTNTNNSKTTGIFGWAEYLMALSNAKLKSGTISCDLDPTIQVGQTFIDESKYKFGYVVELSKQVSVTGTATMSFSLSYVRDAVPVYNNVNAIVDINVDLLPVLTDIENSFASSGS
jgi:hypothetical protein